MDESVQRERRSRREKCNEDAVCGSQKGKQVMDIDLDEIIMTSLGKLKVIV